MARTKWTRKFPSEPGCYWFVGERYGRNEFTKKRGEKPQIELQFCEASMVANGMMVVGDGQFMSQDEFGDEWWFAKASVPETPKFAKGSEFIKILKKLKEGI